MNDNLKNIICFLSEKIMKLEEENNALKKENQAISVYSEYTIEELQEKLDNASQGNDYELEEVKRVQREVESSYSVKLAELETLVENKSERIKELSKACSDVHEEYLESAKENAEKDTKIAELEKKISEGFVDSDYNKTLVEDYEAAEKMLTEVTLENLELQKKLDAKFGKVE
ncbi:hypothetical protein [Listeria phage LP-KV022]|uniref:Uncharacterized protein n=2 Tax=Homburgvirus LP110 TaxID=1921128 RepID=A0A5A4K6P6_9CAUD|nr:hypothetical protein LP110_088 [Listeria phage LP-110]AGI11591.1 hypothetical protein LP110_088 [Listeria phage LP-110]AWY07670.1 hypothetical protein [Listeria phage LP-KV022]